MVNKNQISSEGEILAIGSDIPCYLKSFRPFEN